MAVNLIEKVLGLNEFKDNPPVLVDIGASGAIHPKWKSIAKQSICICFDADSREFGFVVKESSEYKKLYVYNAVVTDRAEPEVEFYLTKFPYCSSTLKPDSQRLADWYCSDLFEVEQKLKLNSVTLKSIMEELKIPKVDWFKTDSQGTDLRLFKSLGEDVVSRVLAAEFEPGILDSYEGEDKLYSVIQYMDNRNFWMSDIKIGGFQRITRDVMKSYFSEFEESLLKRLFKMAPGCAEVTYLNSFKEDGLFDKRDFLLGWVFATIENQHGFAIELAQKGLINYQDSFFEELLKESVNRLRSRLMNFNLYTEKLLRRFFKIY